MAERISFEDQISRNKIKSVFLMVLIIIFFIVLGYIIALILDPSYFFIIMIIAIIFSMSYTIFSYYNSDKIALSSVKARLANSSEHSQFMHSVENMAIASGLEAPKAYVMDSEQINAFASGRDPKHAVICVTTGALKKLSKQELEGVIAHEMAHVANFDIRFMTLTAVLIGIISILAEIFLRSLWFSSGNRDRGKGGAILLILGVLFAILAPIAANLVSLAISRKREFTADATGVKFTRYPPGLASALKKIKSEHVSEQDKHRYAKALAPLFISNPYKKLKASSFFSTHPSIDQRIAILEKM
ncbi:M48 family metallopeptidase [Candidatus Pacearchaeota archaeon]|nr:M48 family metallopeptidase [Candidatus Pacearchaeota archaeon]